MPEFLTSQSYISAANLLNCKPNAIRAVALTESAGKKGFLPSPDDRLIVRLENHWLRKFWPSNDYNKFTSQFKYDLRNHWKGHSFNLDGVWLGQHISPPGNLEREWQAFNLAYNIYPHATLMSSSYGTFQTMGFNYKLCGWPDVESMFADMQLSEEYHLQGFVNYCKSKGLAKAFQNLDWRAIEIGYNGGGQNGAYARIMKSNFEKLEKGIII